MKSNQQGFTLIELIIVIVILGILAVTASPKFMDIQGDARGATLEGVESSLKGAVNIAYSKALIQGVTGTTDTPESTTGSTAIAMVYGYPDATEANIGVLIEVADFSVDDDSSGTIRIYPSGGAYEGDAADDYSDDEDCYLSYEEAADADTPPVFTLVITGC